MAKDGPHGVGHAKRGGFAGIVSGFVVLAAALYAIGFVLFLVLLPRPTDPSGMMADAIIALTGEGDRLAPAVMLLEEGRGSRLLITGVNRATSKAHLKSLLHGGRAFDCCADLGFAAADTRGNAREAAEWMRAHHYASAIVVTAAYHMPRSMVEFEAAMPGTKLIPYPVPESRGDGWQIVKRFGGEYAKFLASYVRNAVSRFVSGRPA